MYDVRTDELVDEQLADLPASLVPAYLEVRTLLEVAPWSGDSMRPRNPAANIYSRSFGPGDEGTVIYLIRGAERVVNVLEVIWVD